jgi:aspartyl-tRNA(Asn)/glutamyl-tRNA(Gln) amidotransferase subunit C
MIARETILHVAELAELSLDDAEVDVLTRDLAAIVRYVEQLGEVDTEGVSPMRTPHGLARWRADEAAACLTQDEALAQAPLAIDGAFAVPPFIKRT